MIVSSSTSKAVGKDSAHPGSDFFVCLAAEELTDAKSTLNQMINKATPKMLSGFFIAGANRRASIINATARAAALAHVANDIGASA